MNSLLYFMRKYYISDCLPGSFHANVVKELYYTAKDFGNETDRSKLCKSTLRFAEAYCHNVYQLGGVPFWFYYFFCVLVDSSGVYTQTKELFTSMTPEQLDDYFKKIDEEIYALRVKEDNK